MALTLKHVEEFVMSVNVVKTLLSLCFVMLLPGCKITIIMSHFSAGNVTSDDGYIDCPTVCSHEYPSDTTVELSAKAEPGYVFTGFDYADDICVNGAQDSLETGKCTVAAGLPKVVTALFALESEDDCQPGEDFIISENGETVCGDAGGE